MRTEELEWYGEFLLRTIREAIDLRVALHCRHCPTRALGECDGAVDA